MSAPVLAKRLTATGVVTDTRTRVKGVYLVGGATAGTLQLKDGSSAGAILLELDTAANTTAATVVPVFVKLPGEGILFTTSTFATFTGGLVATTVVYG